MSVDDHGLEVLKKAAEEVTPGSKAEYLHRVRVTNFSDISGFIDGIEGLLTTIRDNADELEGFTDGLEALLTAANALLTTIRDNADQLEGYTDGLEGLITTLNSILTDIEGGIPEALGQTTKANSMPVVLPSDQSPPDFVTIQDHLKNAGSKLMNVNGTLAVPIKFTLAPTAGLTYFVESLSLFLVDIGTMDYGDFGSIAGALANGLLVSVKSKGTIYPICNIVDNIDLTLFFKADPVTGVGGASTGFLNDGDYFVGTVDFNNPIIIQNSTADEIYAEVRDSLSALDHLRCVVKYKRAS
jgi:hypothetical protein